MAGSFGSGSGARSWSAATPTPFFSLAPCTVTNDGQKPLTQEKSLLQLDWSMLRLRPHSVSSGCTETQFDFSPQSPQPSQTRSLMSTRLSGSGKAPRFLRRRAGLVVDEDGDAGDGRELTLHRVELVAMMDRQPARPDGVLRIFPRLV